ncbi:inositol-trisphosphate 3-kinase like protein [Ditylenchus destructor]|nr:inositol-trisphosphate 3-kinase like protein [Ditylenchus destructor]
MHLQLSILCLCFLIPSVRCGEEAIQLDQVGGHEGDEVPSMIYLDKEHKIVGKLHDEVEEHVYKVIKDNGHYAKTLRGIIPNVHHDGLHEREFTITVTDKKTNEKTTKQVKAEYFAMDNLEANFPNEEMHIKVDIKMGTRAYNEDLHNEEPNEKKYFTQHNKYEDLGDIEWNKGEWNKDGLKKNKGAFRLIRDRISSTATLGFRIVAYKANGVKHRNTAKLKDQQEILKIFCDIFGDKFDIVRPKIVARLIKMRDAWIESKFPEKFEAKAEETLYP